MDEEILKRIEAQEEKIEKIYVSVEKTRKYFLWNMISNIVFFLLPLIGLIVAIPTLIDLFHSYTDLLK